MEATIIEKAFSKGFIQGAGRNKVSAEYASYIRNARIDNASITIRRGHKTLISDVTGTYVKGITANEHQGNLLVAKNSKLWKANTALDAYTEIGSIAVDNTVTFLNYGKYTMMLTGAHPYVYDGASLLPLSYALETYTKASLAGGTSATAVVATWNAVTDGSFRITIDGTQRDVTGLNFSTDTTMFQIAARIQAAIRALTSRTEIVYRAINMFYIKSSLTTASSAITVTSAAGVGTDISGAGATAFLDAETGRGTVTASVQTKLYTPAYITSGNAVTSNIATWAAVSNGSFNISIDGVLHEISGIDFTGVTTLAGVASIIQTKIRAFTFNTETVEYTYDNKFIIKSSDTSSLSAITVTTAGTIGTDISGVAAGAQYLDMDSGATGEVVTNAVQLDNPLVNPKMGTVFSGFTCIVGNTEDTKNNIYFSQPIGPTTQNRCYRRYTSGGVTAEKISTQSEILGILGTINNMFVWTKERVEYMDKNSINSINGTAALYLNVMGEGDQLLNYRIPVSANDMAFYITKDFIVKSIGYISGTTNTTIGELSDRAILNIKDFLQTELNSDQSQAFGFRDGNLIQRHLRSVESLVNDLILIYDITNDSRLCDNNKYFSGMCKFNSNTYAGSVLNSSLIQDKTGYDDDGVGIPFEYKTQWISFGNPTIEKNYQGFEIAGEINTLAKLQIDFIIDDNTINTFEINGADFGGAADEGAIGDEPIGGSPVGGGDLEGSDLSHFERVADHGQIMQDGKSMQLYIYGSEIGQLFYLDYLSAFVKGRLNGYQLNNKF